MISLQCTIDQPKHGVLLFGGLRSGYISLLHGTGFNMPYYQPAHSGCVIAMRSCWAASTASADLISLGVDNILKLWRINVDENVYLITLKCMGSIHMDPLPYHFELLGPTLCLVHGEKKVDMLDCRVLQGTSSVVEYGSMPILTHEAEDDHVEIITCLTSSPQLGLFATCSLDGHVKLWSEGNSIVSEINLGSPLASVAFASDFGELVIGIQKDLYMLLPSDYLPPNYLSLTSKKDDSKDFSRPFNSNAKFWQVHTISTECLDNINN